MEQLTLDVCRSINERPGLKRAQRLFLQHVGSRWVGACVSNLLQVHGIDRLRALRPEKGVILCANHRTFFDLYVVASIMYKANLPWNQKHFYPVRSNYFYETWTGLSINLLVGGGSMYPPIFRDSDKAEHTKASVERVIELLNKPGVVVGLHPEGKRGTGADPYQLLPAQPGIGQIAHQSGAPVVPIWIRGLRSNFTDQVRDNFDAEGSEAIVVEFGEPVELDEYLEKKGRVAVYKRMSDHILADIKALGEIDRARTQL
jgi:1-acyl-sn-glycerol-3-phosphate acyltransferase